MWFQTWLKTKFSPLDEKGPICVVVDTKSLSALERWAFCVFTWPSMLSQTPDARLSGSWWLCLHAGAVHHLRGRRAAPAAPGVRGAGRREPHPGVDHTACPVKPGRSWPKWHALCLTNNLLPLIDIINLYSAFNKKSEIYKNTQENIQKHTDGRKRDREEEGETLKYIYF